MAPHSIPNDIYQHSIPRALSLGSTELSPPVGRLTSHGTHGLGTFEDGSLMVLIDSIAWRISRPHELSASSDGGPRNSGMKVQRADQYAALPFTMVTVFYPAQSVEGHFSLQGIRDVFQSHLPNSFMPFEVMGHFSHVDVRVEEQEYRLARVKGTIFGFHAPKWAGSVSVDGLYVMFLSEPDERGMRQGGELTDFWAGDDAEGVVFEWATCGRFHLGLPRGEKWEKLQLKN